MRPRVRRPHVTMPPPPPDRVTAFEPRPAPLPARGLAVGVAVAGVLAVALRGYVLPMLGGTKFDDGPAPLAGALVLAAVGGVAGGWPSRRRGRRGPAGAR